MMGNTIFYHNNCMDGIGSAWVMQQYLRETKGETPLDRYIPCNYGKMIPWEWVDGRNVYILDFSFELKQLKEVITRAAHVTMLDHHPRSEKIVNQTRAWLQEEKLQCAQVIYRQDQSGALMTWNYCFPNTEVPMIIQHISDRDLWQFNLPDTVAIMDAMSTYPKNLKVWDKLFEAHDDGRAIVDFLKAPQPLPEVASRIANNEINWVVHATMRLIDIHWTVDRDGHTEKRDEQVPLINCSPTIASSALARLAASHPFAMAYFDTRTSRIFSLRSTGFNVREVAEYYRGGGHDQAAGFKVPRSHHLACI